MARPCQFVPDLAETWEMTDDKTHIFKLRPGVKFHNGEVCDAEAVKWSMERVKTEKIGLAPRLDMAASVAGSKWSTR